MILFFPATLGLLLVCSATAEEGVAVPGFRKTSTNRDRPTYKAWSDLSKKRKRAYEDVGIPKSGYDMPGCNAVEQKWFGAYKRSLGKAKKRRFLEGLKVLKYTQGDKDIDGSPYDDDFDCYFNHYNAYDYDELVEDEGLQNELEVLGYTSETLWEEGSKGEEYVFNKKWRELSKVQREAAKEFCYNKFIWDNFGTYGEPECEMM